MPHPDDEHMLDVAHGDPALARHLRQSLQLLRQRADSDDFRRLVDDVLTGRTSLRDAYTTPAFAAGLNPGVEQFARRYEQLDPDERAHLAEQGQQALNAERERLRRDT